MRLFVKQQRGFTLIELLVVVAIIGLLVSIISVSLTNSRIKARDTRRVSDIKQIKTGMDLYYSNGGGYPDTAAWVAGNSLSCNGTNIMQVPKDPAAPLYQYQYAAQGTNNAAGCGGTATVWTGYQLTFYMEGKAASYTMDQEGTVRDSGGNVVSFDSLLH